jgi:dinuclear metal center YbgI/SA1388 family protein
MMKIDRLITMLEEIAPPGLAEELDRGRIGLIVRGSPEISKIATALDPTPYVIRRAIEERAGMLVTHHTLIWDPVNHISEDLALQLRLSLDSHLSLYSMHTNYDNAPGGVNDVLAGLVGLSSPGVFYGGRAGNMREMSLREFAMQTSKNLRCPVEYVGDDDRKIMRVAVVAGSGFRQGLGPARQENVDVLVSSELKNDVIRDRGNVALVSAPHYYTEAPAMMALAERLNDFVPSVFIDDPPRIKVVNAFERDAVERV